MTRLLTSLTLLALHCAFLMRPVHSNGLLQYEPVQYLKAHLPSPQSTPFTNLIKEAMPVDAAEFSKAAKGLLKAHLGNSGTSVVLVKGERVLVQQRPKGLQWDTPITLPYSNVMSLMSVVLPILLEGYKGSMIRESIGKVLKGKDREHPLVTGRETKSFLDLINKLPVSGKTVKLDSPSLVTGLKVNGELAVHFVNAILESAGHEAWMDALMALDAGITREDNGDLNVDISSLLQLSLTVTHDMQTIGVAPKKERISLDDDKYLFGWWFNCAKDSSSHCLIPNAPKDTIFSLSPDLRLYVTPSLELTLIVLGPGIVNKKQNGGKNSKSMADILIADNEIWRQFTSSVPGASEQSQSEGNKESVEETKVNNKDTNTKKDTDTVKREAAEETTNKNEESSNVAEGIQNAEIIALIHWMWPVLVFLFWVTFSHVWVYWMLHMLWYFITSISSKAHIPRPKTPADAGN